MILGIISFFINKSQHILHFPQFKTDAFVCIFLVGHDSEGGFPGFLIERWNVFISVCVRRAGVLVLMLESPGDLSHVGAGEDHGDQLNQGQHEAHGHVDRQDGGHLVLEQLLEDEHASVLVDGGSDALGFCEPV